MRLSVRRGADVPDGARARLAAGRTESRGQWFSARPAHEPPAISKEGSDAQKLESGGPAPAAPKPARPPTLQRRRPGGQYAPVTADRPGSGAAA